jgi:hypothetical protein
MRGRERERERDVHFTWPHHRLSPSAPPPRPQVLPDLLQEMDSLPPRERLLSLVQGILAANIFDWGARACVELYTNGTILDIYRWGAGGAGGATASALSP